MNRIMIAALALCFGLGGAALALEGHAHEKEDAQGQMRTIKGEVVDMNCYMAHGGSGKKHAQCSKQCSLGGAPLGVLAPGGDLYLLVENHSKKKAFASLRELAAEQVKVSGELRKRGGVQAIIVDSAEKL